MKDIFYIPMTDKCIVYMPQRDLAFYSELESIAIIEKIRQNEPLTFEDQKSIIFQQIEMIKDEYPRVKKRKDIINHNQNNYLPTRAIIIPTETCNLGCTYCYASAMPIKDKISWELISSTIMFIRENAIKKKSKSFGITFYGGGEPTLQWKYIVDAVNLSKNICSKDNLNFDCTIITNGTLLNIEKIDWIVENNINIQISFDILSDVQLIQRPFANGKNSHSKVIETLKMFNDRKYKVNIRSTVTENNLLSMTETVEYVAENLKFINTLHLEPSSTIGRSITTNTLEPNDKVFIKEFIKAFEKGKELGIYVYCSMSDNVGKVKNRFCNTEFTVTSSGNISACHRYSREETPNSTMFMYGKYNNLSKTFDIDYEKLNSIENYNGQNYKNCETCYAQFNCAGDCLSSRVDSNSVLEDGQRCNIVRDLLKYDLIQELEN